MLKWKLYNSAKKKLGALKLKLLCQKYGLFLNEYNILFNGLAFLPKVFCLFQLSSKLREKENNTDISFYQIYLPKFHENSFKYYWLDLLAKWVECSPMVREIWVQFQVASYFKNVTWYLLA